MTDNKTKLRFGNVAKRYSCLISESKNKPANVLKRYDVLLTQLDNAKSTDGSIKPIIKSNVKSLIESLYDSECANQLYECPIRLIESFNDLDTKMSSYILTEYTNNILPYIKDLTNMWESVQQYNITKEQANSIMKAANQFICADRLLENHKTISKRFKIEQEVLKTRSKGLKYVTENCCTMIDTYNIPAYQKLNLCIEEMSYLFDKNNIDYNRNDFINYVLEYFLLYDYDTNSIKGYKKVLSEGYYINENDANFVSYLFENNITLNKIQDYINAFYINQQKDMDLFINTVNNCVHSDSIDLSYNFNKVLYFINDIYRSEILDNDLIIEYLDALKVDIDNILNDLSMNVVISREFIECLIDHTIDAYDNTISDFIIKSFYKDLLIILSKYQELLYTESNLINISFVNNPSIDPVPLSESKIFKHHNIIRAIANLDKYLGEKCKAATEKMKNKVSATKSKVDNILFPEKEKKESKVGNFLKDIAAGAIDSTRALLTKESTEYYSYIGEDNKFDITIYRLPIEDAIDYDIHQELSDLCEEFNIQLERQNIDSARCYYIINPSIAEIHLKESTPLLLSDEEVKLVAESNNDEEIDYYLEQLATIDSYCDLIAECDIRSVEDKLFEYFTNEDAFMDEEKFSVTLEALSLLGVSESTVSLFGDKYLNHKYLSLDESADISGYEKSIKTLESSYTPLTEVNLTTQIKAYLALDALLEVADDKKYRIYGSTKSYIEKQNQEDKKKINKANKDFEEDKEEIKKNPFKGINLNTMKLYLQGLKAKFSSMTQKEKEVSKNLDMNFRRLVKGMKDALISDRREAIIKGSVVPSFSKCLKIAIGLAGVAKFGNPAVAAIVAIGGFAMSKHLTKKERILLLDEIETELDVVEKEIQMAESNNNMKKYRALLQYRKDLQRQYQRIRYNVRVGKDLLPNSTIGIKNYQD